MNNVLPEYDPAWPAEQRLIYIAALTVMAQQHLQHSHPQSLYNCIDTIRLIATASAEMLHNNLDGICWELGVGFVPGERNEG